MDYELNKACVEKKKGREEAAPTSTAGGHSVLVAMSSDASPWQRRTIYVENVLRSLFGSLSGYR
jgi:hypothetical protein